MSNILGFLAPLFWGVLVLSLLVFVHEGGHFLAARMCNVRVTEFFLGMPSRWRLAHKSKKIGTTFGVTPILIGGYAAICGMEPIDKELATKILAYINEQGRATVDSIAEQFNISDKDAMETCVALLNMASIEGYYDEDEAPNPKYYPTKYQTVSRDCAGNTVFDGKIFNREEASVAGEPYKPSCSSEEFFAAEQSHTYQGKGFFKRAFMLLAGIVVNLVTGFILMVSAFSLIGMDQIVDVNVISEVTEGSLAQELGLEDNDIIYNVNGQDVTTWTGLIDALDAARSEGELTLTFAHQLDDDAYDEPLIVTHEFTEGQSLGIYATTQTFRLGFVDASRVTIATIHATLVNIMQLFNPAHTVEVLDNSTSIIGISVMSAEAASMGLMPLFNLAAAISFSLAFMNLLPVPPLDGGKLFIEAIQAVTHKEVPMKIQMIASYIGFALFALLFLYMLRADVLRFIL